MTAKIKVTVSPIIEPEVTITLPLSMAKDLRTFLGDSPNAKLGSLVELWDALFKAGVTRGY